MKEKKDETVRAAKNEAKREARLSAVRSLPPSAGLPR